MMALLFKMRVFALCTSSATILMRSHLRCAGFGGDFVQQQRRERDAMKERAAVDEMK